MDHGPLTSNPDRRLEERRTDDLIPLREQRSGDDRREPAEPFVPVWKRRAAAKLAEVGYVAVADLTGKAA